MCGLDLAYFAYACLSPQALPQPQSLNCLLVSLRSSILQISCAPSACFPLTHTLTIPMRSPPPKARLSSASENPLSELPPSFSPPRNTPFAFVLQNIASAHSYDIVPSPIAARFACVSSFACLFCLSLCVSCVSQKFYHPIVAFLLRIFCRTCVNLVIFTHCEHRISNCKRMSLL